MATGMKESVLIQFGEEVEITERMYEHIKGIQYKEKKFKLVPDEDGIQRKVWYDKKQSRFSLKST